ncbi:hypothetical protein M408DRAFT_8317 [Serendipita vermifera MAFF 305830]|uniref:Uncharacterized protein n=1 Tax=Serendipita vermifera MAFF 305830 TaxID=933852 RepID=A0A0C2WT00_SERVB|nr:hypothetical protein M408DRAFT_8317 [Serendipita vermifera MAFF 305830]
MDGADQTDAVREVTASSLLRAERSRLAWCEFRTAKKPKMVQLTDGIKSAKARSNTRCFECPNGRASRKGFMHRIGNFRIHSTMLNRKNIIDSVVESFEFKIITSFMLSTNFFNGEEQQDTEPILKLEGRMEKRNGVTLLSTRPFYTGSALATWSAFNGWVSPDGVGYEDWRLWGAVDAAQTDADQCAVDMLLFDALHPLLIMLVTLKV